MSDVRKGVFSSSEMMIANGIFSGWDAGSRKNKTSFWDRGMGHKVRVWANSMFASSDLSNSKSNSNETSSNFSANSIFCFLHPECNENIIL